MLASRRGRGRSADRLCHAGHGRVQLCDKLRQTGPNKTTPVIFVTATIDFQVRAQSTLRGASDLIAKPFMFIELTVKALTFALRHRILTQKQVSPSSPAPTGSVRTSVPVGRAEFIG